jgi:glutamate carboxypeptidase
MIAAQHLLEFCQQEEPWLIGTIESLVKCESPTDDKTAVDRCGNQLAGMLERLGGRVTRVPTPTAGDHVRAEYGDGDTQILLLGHFDTVWPVGQLRQMPVLREGDQLKGPGVLDMKAGIGLGMLATRALIELSHSSSTRVVMLWTSDEETGSATSRALLEHEARQSKAVLVLEPALPGGALKTRRKGCGEYELIVHGQPAHAGVDPGKGISAIREIARQILLVETFQDLETGVSVNVGTIVGGSRPNVIAAEARARVDVRAPTMNDAQRIDAAMHGLTPHLPGARVEVRGGFGRPPMERTSGVAKLYDIARQAAADLGQDVAEGSTGGGSDGNFCAALGVPTLDGLGAIGDGAHALHEHVLLSVLAPRAAFVGHLIQRIAAS